jgi:hypothetical protein
MFFKFKHVMGIFKNNLFKICSCDQMYFIYKYFYFQVDVPPLKKSKPSINNPELFNLVKSVKSKTKHIE